MLPTNPVLRLEGVDADAAQGALTAVDEDPTECRCHGQCLNNAEVCGGPGKSERRTESVVAARARAIDGKIRRFAIKWGVSE